MRFSTTLLTSITSRISGTERSTAFACKNVPVRIVADEARLVLRDIVVEQPLDLGAQGLQHFPLLGDRDGLEDFQVGRDGPGKAARTLRAVRPCRRRAA